MINFYFDTIGCFTVILKYSCMSWLERMDMMEFYLLKKLLIIDSYIISYFLKDIHGK